MFVPRHFWATCTKFETRCQRYTATCGNFFYIGATFSGLNYRGGILKKISAIYTKLCVQTFTQCKQNRNGPLNRDTIHVHVPLERTVRQPRSETNIKHHIFKPTAGARCTIFPKLCKAIELIETIKKGYNHFFDPTHSFSKGCTEKFGLNDRRAVFSVMTPQPVKQITSNLKHFCRIIMRINAPKSFWNWSRGPTCGKYTPKSGNF